MEKQVINPTDSGRVAFEKTQANIDTLFANADKENKGKRYELRLTHLSKTMAYPVKFSSKSYSLNMLLYKKAHQDYDGSPSVTVRLDMMMSAWGGRGSYHDISICHAFGQGVIQRIVNKEESSNLFMFLKGGHVYEIIDYTDQANPPEIITDRYEDSNKHVFTPVEFTNHIASGYAHYKGGAGGVDITPDSPNVTHKIYTDIELLNGWTSTYGHVPFKVDVYADGWARIHGIVNTGTTTAWTPIARLKASTLGIVLESGQNLTVHSELYSVAEKYFFIEGDYIKIGNGWGATTNLLVDQWVRCKKWSI